MQCVGEKDIMVRCNMADQCPVKCCVHQEEHAKSDACQRQCFTIHAHIRLHGNKRVVCKEVKT